MGSPVRATSHPAHTSPSSPPVRLPQPLTRLVGREGDVEAVLGRLAAGRLVTLTGTGGVGKTRLAIQVAGELLEQAEDAGYLGAAGVPCEAGCWFVDLAGLSDPGLVEQAVASTLGIREEPRRPVVETLVAHLQAKSALLVLDPEVAAGWAKSEGIEFSSMADLASKPEVREEIEKGLADVMAEFNNAEKVKKVVILGEEWMPDSEELTPTSKLKRRGIHVKYAEEIESIYA